MSYAIPSNKPAFTDGAPDAPDGTSSIHEATVNTPGILDFLQEFNREVMAGADAFTVEEANGIPASDLSAWVGNDGAFDMIFEFSHVKVPKGGKEDWYEHGDWKLTDLKKALDCVHNMSRDNARTPMQWDDSANAGFTTGEPWLPVHDDYQTCNAQAQANDPNSVLSSYRKLAELRRDAPALVAGDWRELEAESEQILAFERTCADERAVTLANFTESEVPFDPTLVNGLTLALGTHGKNKPGTLRPLEAVVYTSAQAK